MKNSSVGLAVIIWRKFFEVCILDVRHRVALLHFFDFCTKIWNLLQTDDCRIICHAELNRNNLVECQLWLIRSIGAVVLDAVFLQHGKRPKVAGSLGSLAVLVYLLVDLPSPELLRGGVEIAEHDLAEMYIIVCLCLADTKHSLVLINHLPDGKAWIAQPEGIAATQPLHSRLDDSGEMKILKFILVERHVLHVVINIDW